MKRKKIISIVALILVVILILGLVMGALTSLSNAVSQSDIDALQQQKANIEAQKKDLASKIGDLKSQQASVMDQKAALDQQNQLTQEEIDNITQQIALYDRILAAKGKDLEAAQANEEMQQQRYATRVRAMEESGSISYLAIIFQSKSFSDMLSRIDSIKEVIKADQQLKANYIAAVDNVKQVQADYESSQADAKAQEADLQAAKAQLESDIAAATATITNLQSNLDAYNAAQAQNEQAESALDKQITEQMAALAKQEEEAKQAAAAAGSGGTGGVVVGTGSLAWPLPSSNYITSGFGLRIHPIFGTSRNHTGWDIAGNQGAQILAADDGTVVTAVYSSSYGNYVIISHGNGMATLYAHQSKLAVTVGEKVTKGQLIGYVGSTGWATGPHLHFEIRVNGTPVDPANYFAAGTYVKGPSF